MGGGHQAQRAPRVVPLPGQRGQALQVVGGAGLVAGFGRLGQPFLQVSRRAGQVPLSAAAEGQVIQRGEQEDPVLGATGRGQAVGEEPDRAVVIVPG